MKLMQFLMGLNEVFQPISSSLLSRETLPDVKKAFAIISREESYRGIASSSVGSSSKTQLSPGYNKNPRPKQNGFKTFNANSASTSNKNGTTLSFSNEQIMKLMNLINEVPSGSVQAHMAELMDP
ncbi:hypothetical protein Tco_1469922 [Tanacetum coccineum]